MSVMGLHSLTNYVSPLLHCEIGVGSVMFELLQDIIDEHIEIYAPGEESFWVAVPALKQIIPVTAKQRDEWDDSIDGITWKIATHQKRSRLVVTSWEDKQEVTYTSNMIKLCPLQNFWDGIVNKIRKARWMLAEQHTKLKGMQKNEGKKTTKYWDESRMKYLGC